VYNQGNFRGKAVQDRIAKYHERRHGAPQPIGEILAELLAAYETRFPSAKITAIETPAVTEDQTCSFYPAATASAS
jgi:hypothetical protein